MLGGKGGSRVPFFKYEKSIPILVPQSLREIINFIIIEKAHEERKEKMLLTSQEMQAITL